MFANVAASQEQAVSPERATVTRAEIQRIGKLAEDSDSLPPESKTSIRQVCEQAIVDLDAVDAATASLKSVKDRIAGLNQAVEKAAVTLRNLRQSSGQVASAPVENLTALENEVTVKQQELAEQNRLLLTIEPKQRVKRSEEAREAVARYATELKALQTQLAAAAADGENELVTKARKASQRARLSRLEVESRLLADQLRLADREDAVELPRIQRDISLLRISKLETEIADRQKQARTIRSRNAVERETEAATEKQNTQFPELVDATTINQQITATDREITDLQNASNKELTDSKSELQELDDNLQTMKQETRIGLTKSIGLSLQKQRSQLKPISDVEERIAKRAPLLEKAYQEFFAYDKQLKSFRIEDEVDKVTGDDRFNRGLESSARDTFTRQQEYLSSLVSVYGNYADTLSELDRTDRTIIERSNEIRRFIDERVLWIQSHPPITFAGFKHSASDGSRVGGLFGDAVRWIQQDFAESVRVYGLVIGLLLFLLYTGSQLRRVSDQIGDDIKSLGFFRMLPTARVVLITLVNSLFWPALVWFVAWRLAHSSQPSLIRVATGLTQLASLVFVLEFFRRSCQAHGLCEAHFALPKTTCAEIRQGIRHLLMVFLPSIVTSLLLYAVREDNRPDLFERLSFIVAMGSLAFFVHRLMHPGHGALRQLFQIHKGGWFEKLKYIWYSLAILIPVSFAILAIAGYFYTARTLVDYLRISVLWLLGLLFVREFVSRWLLTQSRRLRLEQLKIRRTAELQRLESSDDETTIPAVNVEDVDVTHISEQSRRLLNTCSFVAVLFGIWLTWFNVLPALNFLDNWPLWSTSVQVAEEVTNAKGEVDVVTRSQIEAITIADVGKCLLILILTITATRNLPGLLEMSVLNKLPIDTDVRYAIRRLLSYGLVLIGLAAAAQSIGLGWAKVQWLAAALTFGLAFGLQEIFANFVSGLIILVERPVRVGDVVTLGDVSGVISRIRMRATTITDWDRKEYIVPNKEFITGRLLNWTLSDTVNRVVIKFGVAYGSNTEKVKDLILEICEQNKIVLEDPTPIVSFDNFGESNLEFTLRAFLPNLDNRLKTVHDLHTEINKRLPDNGIEFAFPTQDVNVRTMPR